MHWGSVAFVLAGCGRIGFDPVGTQVSDDAAGVADACTLGAFGAPVKLGELGSDSLQLGGPGISIDERAIVFTDATTDENLFIARRADPTGPFGPPVELAALATAQHDHDGAFAIDGTRLYFSSDRMASLSDSLYVAVRNGSDYVAPTVITEIPAPAFGPWVANDDRLLLYTDSGAHVLQAVRADPALPWGTPRRLTELFPSGYGGLTGDGLTIFVEVKLGGIRYELRTATRTTVDTPFSALVPIPAIDDGSFDDLSDPQPSADGRHLYFSGSTGAGLPHHIYMSARVCE